MIKGIGLDAAAVSRTQDMIERFGQRFKRRVFTKNEQAYCDKRTRPETSYAARFAAKEAVMKTLRAGWGSGVRFREIEVIVTENGAPDILLHGTAKKRAMSNGIEKIFISLSHENDLAMAQAIAEG
jgi:holo-[acyl-carrier protein] synthase